MKTLERIIRFFNIWNCPCPNCDGRIKATMFNSIIDKLIWTCNKCKKEYF